MTDEKPLWKELWADPWIRVNLVVILVGTSFFVWQIFFVS